MLFDKFIPSTCAREKVSFGKIIYSKILIQVYNFLEKREFSTYFWIRDNLYLDLLLIVKNT